MSRIITRGLGAGNGAGSTIVTHGFAEAEATPSGGGFDARNPRRDLLGPGIRWANAPRGRPEFVAHNGTRIEHINTVQNVIMQLSDRLSLSGVIRFRFRALPSSISSRETRNLDQFGNVIYPGTGL